VFGRVWDLFGGVNLCCVWESLVWVWGSDCMFVWERLGRVWVSEFVLCVGQFERV